MKVATKPKNPNTSVIGLSDGRVEITHSMSIKQSVGYQTGDLAYGIKVVTANTPKDIARGIRQCESIVEDALANKMPEMHELLTQLAENNSRR